MRALSAKSVGVRLACCLALLALNSLAQRASASEPHTAETSHQCYVGLHLGASRWRDQGRETFNGAPSPFSPLSALETTGGMVGGYAGCNLYLTGNWLVCLEGDGEFANIDGKKDYFNTGTPADSYQIDINWRASVRGRLGYVWGNVLLYGTAGLAIAGIEHEYFQNFPATFQTLDSTRTGWTAGVGIHISLTKHLVGRIEYRHSDFGKITNVPTIYASGFAQHHDMNEDVIRLGLSYKFDN